jgi:hypothetical protein
MRANTLNRLIATSALTVLLTACGGGGGGGGGSLLGSFGGMGGGGSGSGTGQIVINPNLTPTDPSNFQTAEYNRTSGFGGYTGLAQVNAAAAYATGATGQGITVGIIDTGIHASNVEFTGAIDSRSINIVNGSHTDLLGTNPHGTWVAGVVGARRNNQYTHGVAFNSNLLVIKADTSTPGCPTGCFSATDLAASVNYASANGARVVNMSLGSQGSLGSGLTSAIQAAVANNVLFVAAAGNSGAANADHPGMLGNTAGIAGSMIAVGSVNSSNQISSWSNRAGSAMNFYLVAPGENILTTDQAGMALVSGTSFAAPMVAGAAALVMQYAPYLTSAQVADILLRTATDLGAAGTDAIYGRGLLNVGAALQPVGTSSVPNGSGGSASGGSSGGASASATTLALGAAFGDALNSNSLLQSGIMLDEYGRAFGFDMSARVQNAGYQSNLANFLSTNKETVSQGAHLGMGLSLVSSFTSDEFAEHNIRDLKDQDSRNGDTRFALTSDVSANSSLTYSHGYGVGQAFGLAAEDSRMVQDVTEKAAFGNAYLNLVEGGNAALANIELAKGLTMNVATGMEADTQNLTSTNTTSGDRSAYATSVNYETKRFAVGLNAGMVNEGSSTLGSDSDGALQFGSSATTQFVGATARINLKKGLTLAASYTFGTTSIKDAQNSLIGDFRGVQSDSFAVALTADSVVNADDRLTLAVSQPVRVASGSANLTVPTGVDGAGAVQYASQRVNLTPTGRQIDVQAGYAVAISNNETLGLSTVGTLNPGHDASADTAYSVGVRYTKKF